MNASSPAVRAAGAIVVGKTNTPEFGAGANTRNAVYGATGNPFDPQKSAAGSSGGSAVALATGMVPLCTGSDTGGSLRNPAAFCGIVGFRPTPGLVPSDKRGVGWSNLPVLGPMARTVADTCLLLSAIAGDDACDPLATTVHGRAVHRAGGFRRPGADRSVAAARRADAGFRLRPDRAPHRRGLRGQDRHCSAMSSPAPTMRRRIAPAPTRRSKCCARSGFLASHLEQGAHPAAATSAPTCAPMSRKACATPPWTWRARRRCRPRCIGAGRRSFNDYDVILSPSITISPRSWRELYPAEIDGKPTRTYFHWLALDFGGIQLRPRARAEGDRGRQHHVVAFEELLPAPVQHGLLRVRARRILGGVAQRLLDVGVDVWPDLARPRAHALQLRGEEALRAQHLERLVGAGAIGRGVVGAGEGVAEAAAFFREHLGDVALGGGEAKIGRQRHAQT